MKKVMIMSINARLIFDFEHRCAIIGGVTKNQMFPDQLVDRLEISMTGRYIRIFGSDADIKKIECTDMDQFMRVLEVAKMAEEIDKEIKVVYV